MAARVEREETGEREERGGGDGGGGGEGKVEKREEGRWGRSGLISPSAATVTREKKETWPQPLVGRIPSSFICSMSCVALHLKLSV